MRKATVNAQTIDEAKNLCPWGAVFVKVEAGYMVFESIVDFEIWNNQK